MNRSDREPLTDEERLLAERLGGDGRGLSPAPAIDAAILAAGRAATLERAARAPGVAAGRSARAPRRWPFAAGVAASLALAVGVAWQLRPAPETLRSADWSEVPATAATTAVAAPSDADAQRIIETNRADTASIAASKMRAQTITTPAPEPADPAPAPASVSDPPVAVADTPAPASRMRTAVPQRAERGTALGAESFAATASAPAAASLSVPPPRVPPSPPAPGHTPLPAPPAQPAPSAPAPANVSAESTTRHQQAAEVPRPSSRAMVVESIDDVPDDSDPPATADAPEVRAAWLVRVRELLDAGRIAEAKASLVEFHRRHPQAELPPDLRALLD